MSNYIEGGANVETRIPTISNSHIYTPERIPNLKGTELHENGLFYLRRPLPAVSLYLPNLYQRLQLTRPNITLEAIISELTSTQNYRQNEIAYLSWLQVRGGRIWNEFPELMNGDVPLTGLEGYLIGHNYTRQQVIEAVRQFGEDFVRISNADLKYRGYQIKFGPEVWTQICKGYVPTKSTISQQRVYETALDTFGCLLGKMRAVGANAPDRNANGAFRDHTRKIAERLPPIMYTVDNAEKVGQIYTLAEREYPIADAFEPKNPYLQVAAAAGSLGHPLVRALQSALENP